MKKYLPLFLTIIFIFQGALAICGDGICETSELGSCRDCALVNRNFVCDNFPAALRSFDPDCTSGTCYDELYLYSNGRGSSCYPGRCVEGAGCSYKCDTPQECASGICIDGRCSIQCVVDDFLPQELAGSCCGIYDPVSGKCTFSNQIKIEFLNSGAVFDDIPLKIAVKILAEPGRYNYTAVASFCDINPHSGSVTLPSESVIEFEIKNCRFYGIGYVTVEVFNETANSAAKMAFISINNVLLQNPWGRSISPLVQFPVRINDSAFIFEIGEVS